MKLKYLILICGIYLQSYYLNSQVTMQYQQPGGSVTNYQTRHIISDFGWRSIGWHKGVDFNLDGGVNDDGFHIISPVGGVVSYLDFTGYKIITIEGRDGANQSTNINFGYGHIFNNYQLPINVNDFVLLNLDAPNRHFGAILNTATGDAISDYAGGTGTVTWPRNSGTVYNVTNVVNSGQAIAPIGGSGGTGLPVPHGFGPHIHLYLAQDPYADPNDLQNSKDPLSKITNPHPNTDYEFSFTFSGITKSIETSYFNGQNSSSINVRCDMQNIGNNGQPLGSGCDTYYETAVMEIDDVSLFIKPKEANLEHPVVWGSDQSKYQLIQGLYFDSKVIHGARLTSNRYPSPGYPSSNNTIDIANRQGNFQTTGIDPNAYCGDGYDEFYFSDIYTRISKNDVVGDGHANWAYFNEDARIKDGSYNIYVKAIDVNSEIHTSDLTNPTEIKIDNFRPFITKLEIHNPTGAPIYTCEWKKNGDNLELHEGGAGNPLDPFFKTTIKFWTSEALSYGGTINTSPKVKIGNVYASYVKNINQKYWEYQVSTNLLPEIEVHEISISGSDANNNPIFDMPDVELNPYGIAFL